MKTFRMNRLIVIILFLGSHAVSSFAQVRPGSTTTNTSTNTTSGIGTGTGTPSSNNSTNSTSYVVPVSLDFTKAATASVQAVVHIKTEYKEKNSSYDDFYGGIWDQWGDFNNPDYSSTVKASGSGVILSSDGYIVTNNHVVEDAEKIEVTLNDNRSYDGKIIGTDEGTDLALIKIDEKNLPTLTFANSDSVKIGEWVLAVGNPFNLTSTVTAGIISAKARNLNILGKNSSIESFLQTDAAVNPGNSGGALVNTDGELVGINAAIASTTGSYAGYSFAIPSNIVKKVVDDFKKYGIVQRGYLGITFDEIDSKYAKDNGLKLVKGIYVTSVAEGSAAQDALMQKGDIITKIGTSDIGSGAELLEAIVIHSPGDKVSVTLYRGETEKQVTVTMKNINNTTELHYKDQSLPTVILGATFDNLTDQEIKDMDIESGLIITKVDDGPLKGIGVREDFIVTYIDGKPVKSASDLKVLTGNVSRKGILIEGIYLNGMRSKYMFGR